MSSEMREPQTDVEALLQVGAAPDRAAREPAQPRRGHPDRGHRGRRRRSYRRGPRSSRTPSSPRFAIPRNWLRPAAAGIAGGIAGGALVLIEVRRRRRPSGASAVVDQLRNRLP